ncbi:hypothetical protein AAKU55_004289 [Oxalobacteraceae bacterium GrIS 1.11]
MRLPFFIRGAAVDSKQSRREIGDNGNIKIGAAPSGCR